MIFVTFAEPIIYLVAFGVGMSSLIPSFRTDGAMVTYRSFIFAGVLAQSMLNQGFFLSVYGGYARAYHQRLFLAMIITPISLSEVVLAEIAWNALRSSVAPLAILIVGSVAGDFHPLGALACVPFTLLGCAIFSSVGLWVVALAKSQDDLRFSQFYLFFPMFLLCGIFFPVERLPGIFQILSWAYPLRPLLSIMRGLLIGTHLDAVNIFLVLLWFVATMIGAHHFLLRRIAL
jgi:lipooligosaccharide transport system permease protein